MRLSVRVIPNAKKARILTENGFLKVYLTVPAVEGQANKALIAALAEHLGVKKSHIHIIKGLKSRDKTINIED